MWLVATFVPRGVYQIYALPLGVVPSQLDLATLRGRGGGLLGLAAAREGPQHGLDCFLLLK